MPEIDIEGAIKMIMHAIQAACDDLFTMASMVFCGMPRSIAGNLRELSSSQTYLSTNRLA